MSEKGTLWKKDGESRSKIGLKTATTYKEECSAPYKVKVINRQDIGVQSHLHFLICQLKLSIKIY